MRHVENRSGKDGRTSHLRVLFVGIAVFFLVGMVARTLMYSGHVDDKLLQTAQVANFYAKYAGAARPESLPANPTFTASQLLQPFAYQNYPAQSYGYPVGSFPPTSPGYQPVYQAPPPLPPCDTACKEAFTPVEVEISKLSEEVTRHQALCLALKQRFSCECDSCGAQSRYNSGVDLQKQYCAASMVAPIKVAGGPCMGFESFFCAAPFGESFCSRRTWSPTMGTTQWIERKEVVDPGNSSATAGLNLAESQLPQYLQSTVTSLSTYLNYGTNRQQQKARLSDQIANQIAAFEPDNDDRERQQEAFKTAISPAEAKRYASELQQFQDDMKQAGTELPASTSNKLNELETAADNYNAATRAPAQVLLVLTIAAIGIIFSHR